MNKQKYWTNYYQDHIKDNFYPTNFAYWIVKEYPQLLKGKKILDLCCGNGRDSYFLALYCNSVVGIDFAVKPENRHNVSFVNTDIVDYINGKNRPDIIYSRFGLHAFTEEVEDKIIQWGIKTIIVEGRSDKGNLTGTSDDHYRRLLNATALVDKLRNNKYSIACLYENAGFAKFGSEDPVCLRTIANK